MKIFIKVKPNSKDNFVKPDSSGGLKVGVKEPPRDGRANEAIIKMLAKHFGVPSASIKIKTGGRSKQKLVEIND